MGWVMEDRSRQYSILKLATGGGIVFAFAVAAGLVLINRMAATESFPSGTIQIARHGAGCQRLVIDNSTGAIKSSQQTPCGDAPKGDAPKEAPASVEAPPSRYSSGGRVDAIRDSFKNR
jgi:hypothetical protein